jgi:hypothetical protein
MYKRGATPPFKRRHLDLAIDDPRRRDFVGGKLKLLRARAGQALARRVGLAGLVDEVVMAESLTLGEDELFYSCFDDSG